MSHNQAFLLLKRNAKKKVETIYDYGDNAQAFQTLLPGFEYPDWSYRTVGYFLRHVTLLQGV